MQFDFEGPRTALLILDVQRLFTAPDGPFESSGYGGMIDAINRLSAHCRAAAVPVLFSRYAMAADGSDAGLLAGHPVVASGMFSVASPWTALDEALQRAPEDLELVRNRPGAFHGGELDAALQRLGREQLVLAGLSTNNAVSTTAREAFARDMPVMIARECTAAAPFEPASDLYLEILDTWTAEVLALGDALDRL
ncbi:MAG: cysteine hydrolase [Gammaproteobacteria bacterium]|nr:cysteine hydrolase [Gammaproteobacteria bacterium]